MSLRIGTRGSALALVQTETVVRMLADQGIDAEIVTITTAGDTATGVPLHAIGGRGSLSGRLTMRSSRGRSTLRCTA